MDKKQALAILKRHKAALDKIHADMLFGNMDMDEDDDLLSDKELDSKVETHLLIALTLVRQASYTVKLAHLELEDK